MFNDKFSYILLSLGLFAAAALIVPLIAHKRKAAGIINFIFVALAALSIWYLGYHIVFFTNGGIEHHITVFNLHIPFLIDGLSSFFMAIIALLACISSFYSIGYMEHYPDYKLRVYYAALPLFIMGMVLLVIVDDLFIGFTVAWQMMTLASYFLVKFEHKIVSNVANARKYLALMEVAWLLIIASTLFISNYTFGDSLHVITKKLESTQPFNRYAVFGLLLTGFAFKAGIFPLGQLWLPDAHSIAPSPISALLSGVMLKTGIYGIIRTFFWMMPDSLFATDALAWGIVISILGVLTLFIGTAQSLKQQDMKRLLAYSSIGQIGYIVFAIGNCLILLNSQNQQMVLLAVISCIGALYHVLNHAIFKGLLFLTSGSVLYATGTKDLNKLGGLISIMPMTALVAGVASLSIAGIPPFSGFASKWTIISSALLSGSGMVMVLLFGIIALFTSALTLACYVKFFGMTFTSSGAQWNTEKTIKEVSMSMLAPKLILTVFCLFQGLFPVFFYKLIMTILQSSSGNVIAKAMQTIEITKHVAASPLGIKLSNSAGAPVSMISPVLICMTILFLFVIIVYLKKIGGSQTKSNAIWLCGYQQANNNNRFTDRNMFAALKKALWWTGGGPTAGNK